MPVFKMCYVFFIPYPPVNLMIIIGQNFGQCSPPAPASNDSGMVEMSSAMSKLMSASPADLDNMYINMAVLDHTNDLTELNSWENMAQNADLKAAISQAIPVVQRHLDKAKEIQMKMSGMATNTTGAGMKSTDTGSTVTKHTHRMKHSTKTAM